MDNRAIIVGALAVSILVLIDMYRRGGTRNALFVIGTFFVFFAFGPVINYLLGQDIYAGTVVANIPQAAIGFVIALLAMWIASLIYPQRKHFDASVVQSGNARYELLPLAFLASSLYAVAFIVAAFPAFLTGSKRQMYAIAGPGHSTYLIVATSLVAFYFIARRQKLMRHLYVMHCIAFVAYCLAFRERDFFLIFIAVLVHHDLVNGKRRSAQIVAVGLVAALGATWLFAARGGDEFSFSSVLNQGSILFVDSFIISQFPDQLPFEVGGTYAAALVRLLPTFLYDSGTPTLVQRLAEMYAPGGQSGYGFSLSAEAYMNFGLIGIPIVFFLITLIHRYFINRLDRGDWYPYASIVFMNTWMYSLRGESLQLVKTFLFAAVIFVAFRILSGRTSRKGAHTARHENILDDSPKNQNR